MLVALVSKFAAEAAMEAWVLLVELVTAVSMVAPVAWAPVTCAEVAFRVVTFAAGGAEPAGQWGKDPSVRAGSAPAVLSFVHQMSNGTSHSWWLSRLLAGWAYSLQTGGWHHDQKAHCVVRSSDLALDGAGRLCCL